MASTRWISFYFLLSSTLCAHRARLRKMREIFRAQFGVCFITCAYGNTLSHPHIISRRTCNERAREARQYTRDICAAAVTVPQTKNQGVWFALLSNKRRIHFNFHSVHMLRLFRYIYVHIWLLLIETTFLFLSCVLIFITENENRKEKRYEILSVMHFIWFSQQILYVYCIYDEKFLSVPSK